MVGLPRNLTLLEMIISNYCIALTALL